MPIIIIIYLCLVSIQSIQFRIAEVTVHWGANTSEAGGWLWSRLARIWPRGPSVDRGWLCRFNVYASSVFLGHQCHLNLDKFGLAVRHWRMQLVKIQAATPYFTIESVVTSCTTRGYIHHSPSHIFFTVTQLVLIYLVYIKRELNNKREKVEKERR